MCIRSTAGPQDFMGGGGLLDQLAHGLWSDTDFDPMAPPAGQARLQLTHFCSMPKPTAMGVDQTQSQKPAGGGSSTRALLLWAWWWSLRPAGERPCVPSQRAFLGLAASHSHRLAVLERPLVGVNRPEILLPGQSLARTGSASWSGTAKQAQNACPAPVICSRPLSYCCPGPMVKLDCHARSGPRGGAA